MWHDPQASHLIDSLPDLTPQIALSPQEEETWIAIKPTVPFHVACVLWQSKDLWRTKHGLNVHLFGFPDMLVTANSSSQVKLASKAKLKNWHLFLWPTKLTLGRGLPRAIEIVNMIVHSISLRSSLRSYVETLPDLTLVKLWRVLCVCTSWRKNGLRVLSTTQHHLKSNLDYLDSSGPQ